MGDASAGATSASGGTVGNDDSAAEGDGDDDTGDTSIVLRWLRHTLREWEAELNVRANAESQLAKFRIDKGNFRQSRQYLRPLRKALRDQSINPHIVSLIRVIVE